jgi:hypothetical protein
MVGKSIIRRFFGTVESGDFAIFAAIRAMSATGSDSDLTSAHQNGRNQAIMRHCWR